MHSIRPKIVTALVGVSLVSGAGGVVGSGVLAATATTLSTVRINAGGPAVTDGDGTHWLADTDYVGGKLSTTTATIANTRKSATFRDMRFDVSAYHIPVVNGTYDVNLLEAEIYFDAAGKRVFNVSAEGKSVAKNVDVFKLAGGKNRAYWIKFTTTVTDGSLDLGFTKSVNYPQVSGISVLPAATAPSPTPTPTPPPSPSPTPSPTATPTPPPSPTPTPTPSTTPSPTCTVSELLVPSCGVWWGAMANPKSGQTQAQALAALEAEQGRPFDIDHYYYKDDQHFPDQAMIDQARQPGAHRLLLLSWKPATDHTWAQVAAGAVDARIDSEAAYLKSHFTEKFFLVIWHEPENDVNPTAGSGNTAADYAAMFRHTILRLRGDGVTNAVTAICYEATPYWGSQSWWPQLWPGADVVDWMGEDAYSIGTSSTWGGTFGPTINRTDHYSYPNWPGFYTWAQKTAPDKPIMIPEYGANEISGDPSHKANFFNTMPNDLAQYPAVKAVVYWNNPASTSGEMVESSQTSIDAFHTLAQQPTVNPQTAYGEAIS